MKLSSAHLGEVLDHSVQYSLQVVQDACYQKTFDVVHVTPIFSRTSPKPKPQPPQRHPTVLKSGGGHAIAGNHDVVASSENVVDLQRSSVRFRASV